MDPLGTTRSTASSASQGAVPREDADVYLYTLRVAVLAANMAAPVTPKLAPALEPAAATATAGATAGSDTPHLRQSSTFRPTDGWTKSILSLGDVFKDPSGARAGSIKFPKEFLKAIDAKMERVARGTDPAHSDALFRQTIGAFYGKFADPAFQRTLAKNRQTEELILTFGTTASAVLRRQLPGDEWKVHLDHQVGQFIVLVRDALRSRDVKNVPPELLQRLDAHCAKLSAPDGQLLDPSLASQSQRQTQTQPPTHQPHASTSRSTLDALPPPAGDKP